ncbi:MAG: pyridoxal phosphate-dependent aminotransferase [Candidatus Omnitrophica bacterium]|nr:pyridoxal phosphate-dependent aminotransferase [Candidatus Omnitrophota bacterium]
MDKHFSRRTNWDRQTNTITSLYDQLKRDGREIIDLTVSNPTACGFKYPQQEILLPLSKLENLTYAPDSHGLLDARRAVAQLYAQNGIDVSIENIFLTASTSEAYSYLFRLLTDPDDIVLFPSPSYPLFQFLGEINDVRVEFYPLVYEDGWHIDMDALIKQLNSKVKAIVLVNPNNPTGNYVSSQEFERLNHICSSRNISLLSDEVFFDFHHTKIQPMSLAGNKKVLSFTMNGVSKMLGLPQMKLSWIILNGPDELVMEARQRLEIISDTFLSVNTPVQNAFASWLPFKENIQNQIRERITENFSWLKNEMSKLKGSRLLHSQGGWYAVLSISDYKTEEEWVTKLLLKYHVFVHPGFFYDFDDGTFLIVSLLPDFEKFKEGMLRILSRIEQEEI